MANNLSAQYWQDRYLNNQIAWDLGAISPPIKAFIDQLTDKSISILIPGAGHGYEGSYLFENGFKNVYVLDFAELPLENFSIRTPDFPHSQLINDDFFNISGQYDLIIEQTLFCAIDPNLRSKYAEKAHALLKPNGRLVGLFFNRHFDGGPPFGGTKEEYEKCFEPYFSNIQMEACYNSIKPREGTELFVILGNKILK